MTRKLSNQGMTGLHPVSQVGFRLSQVPPSRHRKARMHIERAESIEDDESNEGSPASTPNNEYTNIVSSINSSGRGGRLGTEPSTPLTTSSPALSLGSMASSAHISTPPSWNPLQSRHSEYSQRRVPLRSISPNMPEQQQLHKSILHPPFLLKSQETVDYSSGSNQYRQTKDSHAISASPMRSVSVYRRSLANISPDTTQSKHSLLSQRPNIVFQSGDYVGPLVLPHNQHQQQQQKLHLLRVLATYDPQTIGQSSNPDSDTTPTKRPRKQGVSVSELQTVVSCAKSGYNIWWHRINIDSTTYLASKRPSACLRAYIGDIETVASPHLYSASATVCKVMSSDLAPLEPGRSFTALLSLSVCAAASPQTAKHIAGLLISPDQAQAEAASSSTAIKNARQPRAVDIYQPIRIAKSGSDISILASRFVVL